MLSAVGEELETEDAAPYAVAELLVLPCTDATRRYDLVRRWLRWLGALPTDWDQQRAIEEIHLGPWSMSLAELRGEARSAHKLYRAQQLLADAIEPLFLCAALRVAVEADPEAQTASFERVGEFGLIRYPPPAKDQDRNFTLLHELAESRLGRKAEHPDVQILAVMFGIEAHLVRRALARGVHNAARELCEHHPHLPRWMVAEAALIHAGALS
jgi:hypothetical protein